MKVTNQRERWPLYCSNLEFAQQWLRRRLVNLQSPSRDLHDALSTGLIEEVKQVLHQIPRIDDHLRRQLLYRISLIEGTENPYRILLGESGYYNALLKWNNCLNQGTIDILLNGGIGDHIQQVAMIQSIEAQIKTINIFMSQARYLQLKDLIPERFKLFSLTGNLNLNLIHPFEIFSACSFPFHPKPLKSNKSFVKTPKKYHYLCCWQARGDGDLYSAFNRSIGFETVLSYYQNLIEQGTNPGKIIDITAWKDRELAILKYLGISHYDPASNSAAMLASIAYESEIIITIDTALVHLCASLNISCILLLCYFHDERWFRLINSSVTPSSYTRVCTTIQQEYYGDWSSVMKNLRQVSVIGLS